ncbi:hypothetical protein EGH25_03400 [Haladaptatus sp. F3-133]|uniref:CAP domain-containing protein n=1 Tax=Halorutilus salinus TaxID=2487751 RepID=A0A9Q4C327_9EURY|nr:hypothetical protein [Halorutilus salinus]MCX2818398.1 hypothetical protein [Halorutilus salinus]
MSRMNRDARYIAIVILVAVALSLTGCLDIVNWGDPAEAQPGGEDSTAGEVIVKDAENVTRTLSHNVSSSAIRTRYDPRLERVEVALTQSIDADYMRVDFAGDTTARARLNEEGDRAVLGSSDLWLGGEAEDLTRELYRQGAFEGGPGGFAGASYGDTVNITVSAVDGGVGEVVFQETETIGHGEVNAQVDYLFDSSQNQVRVVYASNVNADYVDVTFRLGGDNISKVRLHNPGDEARISSDYGKTDTLGTAENRMYEEIKDAVQQYDRYRNEDTNFSEIADDAGGALSGIGGYDGIIDELDGLRAGSMSKEEQKRFDALLDARRDLRVTESGDLSLEEITRTYLEYTGQVQETDDIDDFDSVLDDSVFDDDLLSNAGTFLTDGNGGDDDDDNGNNDIPEISQMYDRPERGELLSIQAVAKVAARTSPSGYRQRGGSSTEVLDVSGEISDDGYTEIGGVAGGDPITLPSESTGFVGENGVSSAVGSLDTETVARRVATAANRLREDESGYTPQLESTHGIEKAAQEHADRMENNINEQEELNSIRSGGVPAQTDRRNRIQRYVRNAATVCYSGTETHSLYTPGSYVTLTNNAEGVVERAGVSTTTVNAEGMAPVTVPNYALPLYEAYIYNEWSHGGENTAAYVYSDLVNGTASTSEVADAVVERMTDKNSFVNEMTDSSYRHQGVGVSVAEDTGVIYVTQSFC